MGFEWDENKNRKNKRKHGISFETAALIFQDPFIICTSDHRHEYSEERWQSIGIVNATAIYVAYTVGENHDGKEIIRIISARAATPNEERRYYTNQKSSEGTQSN